MKLWRITRKKHALDRTGEGAKLNGARWNSPGTAAIYAGTSIEIAAFEILVHLGTSTPTDSVLVEIDCPDEGLYFAPMAELPKDWDAIPHTQSVKYGDAFLKQGAYLGLIVPSVVIPEAQNVVLNPMHQDFQQITMRIKREFSFDPRIKVAASL